MQRSMSDNDTDKVRQLEMDWRDTGAKVCASNKSPLVKSDWRKGAPVAPRSGATLSHFDLKEWTSATGAAVQHDETAKLKNELIDLRDEVSSLQRRIALIDRELGPVWAEEDEIKVKIKETHTVNRWGGIVFKLAGKDERRPLFDALLAICIEHGPVRENRKQLAQQMRSYERRAENLEKYLERKAKQRKGEAKASPTF